MNSKTGQLNSSDWSSKKKKEQKRAKIVKGIYEKTSRTQLFTSPKMREKGKKICMKT